MIVFGPVPSRRLGKSLGVNNIPYKICTYSCVYCQVGRTRKMIIERQKFYSVSEIVGEVKRKLNTEPDYVTFVPDGEPTLDINLGKAAACIKDLGVKVAVITNSSLLWMGDVREDLSVFDFVSVKIDAVTREKWRKINRPHPDLKLERILDGIVEFRDEYEGVFVTETMLVDALTTEDEIRKIAEIVGTLNPHKAYLSIPIRPPAEKWVKVPSEEFVMRAYEIFSSYADTALNTGFEGTDFLIGEEFEKEILSIAAVHPIREDALRDIMRRYGVGEDRVQSLIDKGLLKRIEYSGRIFYIRGWNAR